MAKSLRDKRMNQILYISLGGAIVAIILFIVLFSIFSNKKKSRKIDLQIGENNNIEQSITEEANSSIGKKVDESDSSEDETDEWQAVQVTDDTQIEGQLSELTGEEDIKELSSNENDIQNIEDVDNLGTINSTEIADNTNEIISMTYANSFEELNNTTSANEENSDTFVQEEIIKDPTFIMPVEGEIVKPYGKEKLIYSDTLKEWTTHLGIDIKADKTTIVKSSSDGIVKSIKNDPRYGLTVVVEHQNGFTSVYSNLLTAEFVVVGEEIKGGQTIGTVGNSATFEILDDAHLHFEILKDGNSVDPEMYIK